MSSRAARWLFAAVALLFAALFVRLGLWQLDRLGERRAEVADRQARLARTPLRIDAGEVERRPGSAAPFPPSDSAGWRRVVAEGRFDYAREAVLSPRSRQGSPAVYVVTPLVVADSAVVPVIRGSLPAPDGLHAPLARARPVWARTDSAARRVTVHGTAHPPSGEPASAPDTLHAAGGVHPVLAEMDPARLDSIWPWRTAGFYVRADSSTERIPPAADGRPPLRALPPPSLDEGPHRMYAVQWFAFAAIAVAGGGFWLWRERQGAA